MSPKTGSSDVSRWGVKQNEPELIPKIPLLIWPGSKSNFGNQPYTRAATVRLVA